MSKKSKLTVSAILIILAVACRLLPHAWNFTPIVAVALFAGVYLGRSYAIALPLIAMFTGDLFLGFYSVPMMLVVYGSYVLVGLLAGLLKKYKSFGAVIIGSLLASVIFFIATNWAVWQFSTWYTKDLNGLIQCYTMAMPFFRNTLLGNLFYTSVFFGAYEAVIYWARERKISLQKI